MNFSQGTQFSINSHTHLHKWNLNLHTTKYFSQIDLLSLKEGFFFIPKRAFDWETKRTSKRHKVKFTISIDVDNSLSSYVICTIVSASRSSGISEYFLNGKQFFLYSSERERVFENQLSFYYFFMLSQKLLHILSSRIIVLRKILKWGRINRALTRKIEFKWTFHWIYRSLHEKL